MDNEQYFGKEIHRIGFGEAVERGLLTDYKVIILTLNDKDVPPAVQKMVSNGETEIKTDDLTKLIGTINALSKQFLGNESIQVEGDEQPMKRAVAFCSNISGSKSIASNYNLASENYLASLPESKKSKMVTVEAKHSAFINLLEEYKTSLLDSGATSNYNKPSNNRFIKCGMTTNGLKKKFLK